MSVFASDIFSPKTNVKIQNRIGQLKKWWNSVENDKSHIGQRVLGGLESVGLWARCGRAAHAKCRCLAATHMTRWPRRARPHRWNYLAISKLLHGHDRISLLSDAIRSQNDLTYAKVGSTDSITKYQRWSGDVLSARRESQSWSSFACAARDQLPRRWRTGSVRSARQKNRNFSTRRKRTNDARHGDVALDLIVSINEPECSTQRKCVFCQQEVKRAASPYAFRSKTSAEQRTRAVNFISVFAKSRWTTFHVHDVFTIRAEKKDEYIYIYKKKTFIHPTMGHEGRSVHAQVRTPTADKLHTLDVRMSECVCVAVHSFSYAATAIIMKCEKCGRRKTERLYLFELKKRVLCLTQHRQCIARKLINFIRFSSFDSNEKQNYFPCTCFAASLRTLGLFTCSYCARGTIKNTREWDVEREREREERGGGAGRCRSIANERIEKKSPSSVVSRSLMVRRQEEPNSSKTDVVRSTSIRRNVEQIVSGKTHIFT